MCRGTWDKAVVSKCVDKIFISTDHHNKRHDKFTVKCLMSILPLEFSDPGGCPIGVIRPERAERGAADG